MNDAAMSQARSRNEDMATTPGRSAAAHVRMVQGTDPHPGSP